MSNYAATVIKIDNVRKHEGADRLVCVNVFGNNVISGLDTKEGDVYLYFPLESQISEIFAQSNDLIRRKNEEGKSVGGMFDANRRVRCQTLRGEKSMGFITPISALNKTFESLGKPIPEVKVGQEFEELSGVPICCKYVIPTRNQSTNKAKSGKKAKESRLIPGQFAFHFDTAQLSKNTHKVNPDSLISLTWKFHGTSFVVGHCLVKKKLKLHEKILSKIGINIVDTEYDYIYSSRKVIKNAYDKEQNHFYGMDIWTEVGEKFRNKLHKGEQVFGEIVGYTPTNKFIQHGFDYGCNPGEYKVYIYRITQTNIDGIVTELPWHQVLHRAQELGFETVPTIYYGKASDIFSFNELSKIELEEWRTGLFNTIGKKYVCDQDSQFCRTKVPEEGVVLRIEMGDGIENLKYKSFKFLQHETKQLDKNEIDLESEESVEEK